MLRYIDRIKNEASALQQSVYLKSLLHLFCLINSQSVIHSVRLFAVSSVFYTVCCANHGGNQIIQSKFAENYEFKNPCVDHT